MKKIVSAAAVLAAMSMLSVSAFADVYVTISDDSGKLVVALEPTELSDADGDGKLTVNDALYNAHEALFDGGAAAGYGSESGDYGLMLTKLWGVENGGSYGYYVNNASAMSLADEINDGDTVNAFVFTDTAAFSDTYCYFDSNRIDCSDSAPDSSVTTELTLTAATFDENWAPISVPVAGATITINGEKTDFVTDENGWVSVDLPKEDGQYTVSAVSDTQTLVPPVCIVTVSYAEDLTVPEGTPNDNALDTAPSAGNVDAATDSSKGSPDTGIADVAAVAGIAVIAAGAFVLSRNRK
ncbi:MAG: hypothetical protein J6O50_13360 [Ruminiclostridium sp.]|nr:hypothetical protein [Ruminiclostridium sp.]